jgi:hypothetical protein
MELTTDGRELRPVEMEPPPCRPELSPHGMELTTDGRELRPVEMELPPCKPELSPRGMELTTDGREPRTTINRDLSPASAGVSDLGRRRYRCSFFVIAR